jgi:biopolymer transport protein ExbD
MNMTPMIDIVFQLIVFLMVANDLSRRDIEDLDLPRAVHAFETCGAPDPLVVNLLPGGPDLAPALRVRGRDMDLAEFRRFLRPEADRLRADAGGASDLPVLIRADRASRWQDVQRVMQACADRDIRVRSIQFATEDPARSGR